MNFRVKINGKETDICKTRISAYPLNRVWPGHQRPIEQSKEAYYVNFRIDEEAEIEIYTDEKITDFDLKPTYMNIPYSITENSVKIYIDKPCNFSAELNGVTVALFANSEDYSKEQKDGNVIYFGKGEHYPGIIAPKSGQTVFIDEGAVVYGGIFIKNCSDVRVIGHGVLDASYLKRGIEAVPGEKGSEVADEVRASGLSQRDVEYSGAFVAYGCENLYIEGITILNSMLWTMILRNGCKNVTVNNVKIFGQWRYNSDGINICASSDVVVKNSFIRSFDDCVIVRGPFLDGENGDMKNIEIKNCVLWCDWGINMEIFCADKPTVISNVCFRDNYIIPTGNTVMDIQTWFGSENSIVRDVLYENIMIESSKGALRPQYQNTDDTEYVFDDEQFFLRLATLQCGKIGKNLGNQQFEEAADTSCFHSLYENITYRNIHAKDTYDFCIIKKDDILKVKNIKTENCVFGEED